MRKKHIKPQRSAISNWCRKWRCHLANTNVCDPTSVYTLRVIIGSALLWDRAEAPVDHTFS